MGFDGKTETVLIIFGDRATTEMRMSNDQLTWRGPTTVEGTTYIPAVS
jgi:hypothetical protein